MRFPKIGMMLKIVRSKNRACGCDSSYGQASKEDQTEIGEDQNDALPHYDSL